MAERAAGFRADRARFCLMTVDLCPPAHQLRKYGITPEEWRAQFAAQGGRCPICKKKFTRRRYPANDHNHRTGEYRGLLCLPCNDTLGRLHEDVSWLENAASYLTNPPSRDVFITPRRHINALPEG